MSMDDLSSVASPTVSEYSALDFALITLLENIKHEVLAHKIEVGWKRLFIRPDNEPRDIRKQQNLVAGLLNIWEWLEPEDTLRVRQEALESFVWEGAEADFNEAELYEILKRYGYHLFNSYYYILLNEFGQEGLIPVIPGETRPSRNREQLDRFIRKNRLPLHLNPDYLDTYSMLHLPLRAGITPRYLEFYHSEESSGHKGAPKSWLVPNFLGDLGILEKREDYLHRHLCAIISILGKRGDRQGAFVLTSAVPEGLSVEDQQRIDGVIKELWDCAPLADVHRDMSRTSRAINTYLEWTGQSQPAPLSSQENRQLNMLIQRSLTSMGPGGAYILRGAFYDDDRRLCQLAAINSDGIKHILECQFPTSPWLDPDAVRDSDEQPQYLYIDVKRLEDLCLAVEELSALGADKTERRRSAFIKLVGNDSWRGFIQAIFPDTAEEGWSLASLSPEVRLLSEDGQRVSARLLVFREPSGSHGDPDADAVDFIKFEQWVCDALREPELPGSTNSKLARLQREWNQSEWQAESSQDQEYSMVAEAIKSLRGIFKDSRIRGLLAVVDYNTYIPEFEAGDVDEPTGRVSERNAFRRAFCSYPSFWLFESICHSFTEEIEIPALQERVMAEMTSHPFRSLSGESDYVVIRSSDPSINRMIATAFTYMGIPVKEWLPHGSSPPESAQMAWEVPCAVNEVRGWLSERYREYIQDLLKRGENYEPVARAMRASGKQFRIKSIEIPQVGEDFVQMRIELDGIEAPKIVRWRKVPTVDFAFCAFSVELLCRKHAAASMVSKESKEDGLRVETLQVNGKIIPREDYIEALGQALYERSQTVRRGIQTGLSSKFHLFNHEASTGLEMINRLFKLSLQDQNSSASAPRWLRTINRLFGVPLRGDSGVPEELREAIEEARLGACLMELSFGAVLGSPPLLPLLEINPKTEPDRYVNELVKIAVVRGLSEVISKPADIDKPTTSGARRLTPKLISALLSKKEAVKLYGKTLADSGSRKWKSQELIVVLISNSVKHMIRYLLRYLNSNEVTNLPQDFWDKALSLQLDAQSNTLTVENIGPPWEEEFFRRKFVDRDGKETKSGTYAVLKTAAEDADIWGNQPGTIELNVREADRTASEIKNLSQAARHRLDSSRMLVVQVHLPEHFFEDTHYEAKTSGKAHSSSSF